ncbi:MULTISPECIES: tetratricopeptide repeat protein [unclassified Novosphingobium]|uniref:tetratricopeptide repeat protein n=1 Tax=unclassified Novosphingobium TaxID=2644732 RepID=UPI001357DEEC|nr:MULTISPECIES: tetratricopeptide repeat protein [unclassified Novosphingobium]
MIWVFVIGLAVVALVLLLFVLKVPRGAREVVGSALLLGIAGYVSQGSPGQAGAPKEASEQVSGNAAALVDARSKVTNSGIPTLNRWVVTADAFARNGRYADAAEVLRIAVEEDPKSSEAWLAMANAIVAHADNSLTPAALYAYRRAARADPDAPGPPFFLGLAFAQEGRLAETRTLWAGVLERAPADAPWRAPLAQQLQRLDTVIAAQKGEAPPSALSPSALPPQSTATPESSASPAPVQGQ